jgi:hypothetical protein
MKPKETLLNTMEINLGQASFDEIGDEHVGTSLQTPLRDDAFKMDDELKVELIEKHFKEIMHILGLDLSDDSLKGTPHRVAKMYIKEIIEPVPHRSIGLVTHRYFVKNKLITLLVDLIQSCVSIHLPQQSQDFKNINPL